MMTKEDVSKLLDQIKDRISAAIDAGKNVEIIMKGGMKADGYDEVDGVKWKKLTPDGSFSATIMIPKDANNA